MLVQEGLETANNNMALILDYLDKTASSNGYIPETNGLFNGSGNIQDNVNKTVGNIVSSETKGSGTVNNTMPTGLQHMVDVSQDVPSHDRSTLDATSDRELPVSNTGIFKEDTSTGLLGAKEINDNETARKYIANHASKANKKKSEYSDVNQKIYENKAKSYEGTGKVLSSDEMKTLSKKLGVEYDNAKKDGKLYKKLHSIKFPGFKKGGIVSVDDIEKQVKANGDDGIASVKNGEAILTPVQTDMINQLIKKMPDMMNTPINMNDMIPVPDYLDTLGAVTNSRNMNNDININMGGINMYGVNDPKEFTRLLVRSVQTVPEARKVIQAASTDRLAGGGRLGAHGIIV